MKEVGTIPYVSSPDFEEDGLKGRQDYSSLPEKTVNDLLEIDESEDG